MIRELQDSTTYDDGVRLRVASGPPIVHIVRGMNGEKVWREKDHSVSGISVRFSALGDRAAGKGFTTFVRRPRKREREGETCVGGRVGDWTMK